jgi:hypothetical protein
MSYVTNVAVTIMDDFNPEKGKPAGDGWSVVKNPTGQAQDFNQGAGGKFVFIYYQTRDSGDPVSGLRMITGKDSPTPPGWVKIDKDLNAGHEGKFIYLCYATTPGAPKMFTVKAGFGDSIESAMKDFFPQDIVLRQDTNEGGGGKYIFLGYEYQD